MTRAGVSAESPNESNKARQTLGGGSVDTFGLLVSRAMYELDGASTREDGQAMVEYALLLFLIAIVSFVILTVLGTKVSDIFNQVVHDL
jgi:Flp pilus assembly pilin Flp